MLQPCSYLYGGYSTNDNATTGNRVYIDSGGTVTNDVYGGHSSNGAVTGNTVTINGGSARAVYGGYGGTVSNNTIVLNGVEQEVSPWRG